VILAGVVCVGSWWQNCWFFLALEKNVFVPIVLYKGLTTSEAGHINLFFLVDKKNNKKTLVKR